MLVDQVYRARNPKKSLLWQIANRHYDEFEAAYPEGYQPCPALHFACFGLRT